VHLILRVQEEYNTWSKANPGENMDLDTQNTIVNGIFDEVVGTSTWWFGGDKRGYELDRSDADTAKVTKEIERYRIERNNGEPVSVNTMMKIEQVMRQQGLIDG